MKNLNFKKIAIDMNFHDKAKIIFANWNYRKETREKERLISAQEEEAIIEEMRKKNQIDSFNELIGLYNMCNMLAVDIHSGITSLKLAITNVQWFVLALCLNNQSRDRIEELLSIANSHNKKKIERLESMKKSKFDDFLSLLHPSDDENQALETRQPNLRLQDFFENLIEAYKALRKTLYMLDYIVDKAGIDFLPKETKELVLRAKEQLQYVENFEGFLNILDLYKKYMELALMRKNNFYKESFLRLIVDREKALQLSEEEQQEVEKEITGYITKYS